MDIQFSAFDAKTVAFSQLPPDLQKYSTDLIALFVIHLLILKIH